MKEDLLFSLVNYSRFLKINPDDALNTKPTKNLLKDLKKWKISLKMMKNRRFRF